MERIGRTWELAKSSWSVLQRDRELVILPLIGLIIAAAVAVVGLGILATTGALDEDGIQGMGLIILVIVGVVTAVIIEFFAGAVVGAALHRLDGGDPTVGSAVNAAGQRFPSLVGWGAINWTVGAVLQALRERAGFLGDLVAALAGMAWTVASFLALPVIMAENLGPIAALKRSSELLRRTWGENLLSQFGFGIVGLVAMLPGVLIGGAIAAVVPVVGIPLIVLWVLLVFAVMSALTSVFKAVLYRYATEGQSEPAFGDLGTAFTPR
jgi:hypothetical protein